MKTNQILNIFIYILFGIIGVLIFASIFPSIIGGIHYFEFVKYTKEKCILHDKYFEKNDDYTKKYKVFFDVTYKGENKLAFHEMNDETAWNLLGNYENKDEALKIFNSYSVDQEYICYVPEDPLNFRILFDCKTTIFKEVIYFNFSIEENEEEKDTGYTLFIVGMIINGFILILSITIGILYGVKYFIKNRVKKNKEMIVM